LLGEHADLVRALDRQGLDPQAKEKIERELTSTFRDIKKQRDAEEKQRNIEEEMENRRLAEEAAEEEARLRKAADDEDWADFSNDLKTKLHILKPGEPIAEGPHVLSSVQLTLLKAGHNGQKEEIPSHAQWHIDEDVSHAAFRFCSTQMLHAHGEVKNVATHLRQRLANPESAPPAHADIASAADVVLADAKKKQDGGAYSEAGAAFARVLEKSGLPEDISQQASEGLELMLKTHQKFVEASTQYLDAAWEPAGKLIDEAMRGGGGAYNSTILLMRARCFQQRGQWADAVRATGTLLQKVDARGSWLRGQPRMMAVTLGASAAMELGDGEKALKFYQSCLRNDPDQKEISKQYKGLKKLLKLIKEVDEKLAKSQNHKALKTLEEALSGMKGMEVNSGLFRSGLQLRQCKGYSELKRHEEALLACDQSVQRRSEPVSGMFVDPKKLSEALSIRAASHMLDKNFDEAVRDLRECIDLIGQSEDFNQRMHEAQMAQRQWANQRNHREVLELPVNLHQLPKDKQCTYVKKAHKALARKWHPDKAKGNKARASRKMNEVSEAKEKLVEELGC